MTPEDRASALSSAIAYASAIHNNPTLVQVADAYNFFVNLINIARLENNVQSFAVQTPREEPARPVIDKSYYTANVDGG